MKVIITYLIAIVLNGSSLLAQSDFNLALSGKLSFGVQGVSLENSGTDKVFTPLGGAFSLDGGMKLRWRNSLALSVRGGAHLYHYAFVFPNGEYTVDYVGLKLESGLCKYFDVDFGGIDFLAFGFHAGYAFHSNDELTRSEADFTATTRSIAGQRTFISPMIGLFKREDRVSFTLALQYTRYIGNQPFLNFELNSTTSSATGEHRGNYVGLNLIFDYDLKRKTRPAKPLPVFNLPTDYAERENENQGLFKTKDEKVTISVWDHGQVDGDIISLILNGKVILSEYTIKKRKKKVTFVLQPGENTLELIAHNEGRVKPNTATLIVRSGDAIKEYSLDASLEKNASLKLLLGD